MEKNGSSCLPPKKPRLSFLLGKEDSKCLRLSARPRKAQGSCGVMSMVKLWPRSQFDHHSDGLVAGAVRW